MTIVESVSQMFRFFLGLIRAKEPAVVLGRWGYHWEANLKYQKYYD